MLSLCVEEFDLVTRHPHTLDCFHHIEREEDTILPKHVPLSASQWSEEREQWTTQLASSISLDQVISALSSVSSSESLLTEVPNVGVSVLANGQIDWNNVPILANEQLDWVHVKTVDEYTTQPCACCNEFSHVRPKGRVIINNTQFYIAQCTRDSHMWLSPTPDSEYVNELYTTDYFGNKATEQVGIHDGGIGEVKRRKEISALQVNEWRAANVIDMDPLKNVGKKLVEIGGGSGYLSEEAQRAGLDVLNVELCKERAESCNERGIPAFNGDLEMAIKAGRVQPNSCAVVACYDLLEHILNPNSFLQELHGVLVENGVLAIRIPNTPADKGPTLHLIDHVNHFTESSLQQIFKKNGFEIFHSHASGTFYGPEGKTIENITVFASCTKK